jgi:hypothetical protein
MSRWTKFLFVIILGAAAGMVYGWFINPVKYVDISPDSLRVDYKTDFVLMVAEAFHAENDISAAIHRLALLGDTAPTDMVDNAIRYASQVDSKTGQTLYSPQDLELLQALVDAVRSWNPSLEVPDQ